MTDVMIRSERLVKRYGRHRGLDELDLDVRRGEVFGFVGPNGAGKTTTIRLVMGLLRPTSGRLTVLGRDPAADGVALRRRIGYLPGDFVVNGRQSGAELLSYLGHLRGGVPASQVTDLADRFDLDLRRTVRNLSKGNRQKLGVIQAFMHTPELLVLDEPTSGLDPLLQQEFITMVEEAARSGQTVFMSSHVLSEVQRTASRVGFVRDGRTVAVETVEALRERAVRRVEIQFTDPVDVQDFERLSGVHDVELLDPRVLRFRLEGRADPVVKAASRYTTVSLLAEEPDLEEIFLTYYHGDGLHRDGVHGDGATAAAPGTDTTPSDHPVRSGARHDS